MANLNLALIESKSLRDDKLNEISNEKALESLNKAKALIMAFWKGENIATTAQIAEFYEVSEDTIRKTVSRHRDEFEFNGLKVLRGKALKNIKEILSLSTNSPNETIWNPKCVLQLALVLRDSEIAKKIRINLGLDINYTVSFQEHDLELLAQRNYGGKRQNQLKSRKRIDIIDGICVTELKKEKITARHVGQLFEYLSETGLKQGRLIGSDVSDCAIELCLILRKGGFLVEIMTYQLETVNY